MNKKPPYLKLSAMEKTKIIVRPESGNLWWGIYGICEKVGWEDLNLFYENEERIGGVCLNGKDYLRDGIEQLLEDPEEQDYVEAIEKYLNDNKCYYWYFYDDEHDEDFYEVPYTAPKNEKGIKPRFLDIWHPDERIGLSTIDSGVKAFAKEHLGLEYCEIKIQNVESYEDSLKSFKENEKLLFGTESKARIKFSDELVEDLSRHWGKSKEEVLKKLESAI